MTLLDHAYWSLMLTAITTLALGIFVLWKNPRKITNRTLALFNLTVAIWSFGESQLIVAPTVSIATQWNKFLYAGVVFIGTAYLHFILALVEQAQALGVLPPKPKPR